MVYDITVKSLEEQSVIAIRRETKPDEIGKTFQEIMPRLSEFLARTGSEMIGPPHTRYHRFEPALVDLEGGVPVAGGTLSDGEVVVTKLPAGNVAHTVHVGPYTSLGDAYSALDQWIKANGHTSAGGPWEVYMTDPSNEPDYSKWRTEIFWPIV